jgi:hypothetical protein
MTIRGLNDPDYPLSVGGNITLDRRQAAGGMERDARTAWNQQWPNLAKQVCKLTAHFAGASYPSMNWIFCPS